MKQSAGKNSICSTGKSLRFSLLAWNKKQSGHVCIELARTLKKAFICAGVSVLIVEPDPFCTWAISMAEIATVNA
jgi:hypothetical protein